jgi:hypothetical protein
MPLTNDGVVLALECLSVTKQRSSVFKLVSNGPLQNEILKKGHKNSKQPKIILKLAKQWPSQTLQFKTTECCVSSLQLKPVAN